MTSRDFCYWLQGYFELSDVDTLSGHETDMVKRHLALVFKHEIDPSLGHNKKRQEIHDGKKKRAYRQKPRACAKPITYCAPAKYVPEPMISC